jgi:hypothetical protein
MKLKPVGHSSRGNVAKLLEAATINEQLNAVDGLVDVLGIVTFPSQVAAVSDQVIRQGGLAVSLIRIVLPVSFPLHLFDQLSQFLLSNGLICRERLATECAASVPVLGVPSFGANIFLLRPRKIFRHLFPVRGDVPGNRRSEEARHEKLPPKYFGDSGI